MTDRPEAPLAGIRVVDMTIMMAGPFVGRVLQDLGAEIIKIEGPEGDPSRFAPAFWRFMQRGRQAIRVDLKRARGPEVVKDLVASADVFVENLRPGVARQFGLGYDALRSIKQDLVYCSVSGFGQDGPLAERPATDAAIQGFAGVLELTGDGSDFGDPVPTIFAADYAAGVAGAHAVLAALFRRERTGAGSYIDISMVENMLQLVQTADHQRITGPPMTFVAHDVDGAALLIQSPLEYLQRRLLELVATIPGFEDVLEDPRFLTIEGRRTNREEYLSRMRAAIASRPRAYWLDALAKAGVPAGPVQRVSEAFESEQLVMRHAIDVVEVDDDRFCVPASPYVFDGNRLSGEFRAPQLGEHTDAVLQEVLGYSDSVVADLRRDGVIP